MTETKTITITSATSTGHEFTASLTLDPESWNIVGTVTCFSETVPTRFSLTLDGTPALLIESRDIPAAAQLLLKGKLARNQPLYLRLPAEAGATLAQHQRDYNDRKAAEREEAARRKREAFARQVIVGFEWEFGCDCADSARFVRADAGEAFPDADPDAVRLILKYCRTVDISEVAAEHGAQSGEAASYSSYGSRVFDYAGYRALLARATERCDAIEARHAAQLEAARQVEERMAAAAQGREIILVECESRPHWEDLTDQMLNSPAPTGGSFLVHSRVEKGIWNRMKAAGAVYYSRETLEDFDMFHSEPGWRYSLAAISELFSAGFALRIGDEVFISASDLNDHYSLKGGRS